jgi:hypothetical protein
LEQDPFPLYPGEVLAVKVTPLTVVIKGAALKLRATRDCVDANDVKRVAGEMWLFEGPGKPCSTVYISLLHLNYT